MMQINPRLLTNQVTRLKIKHRLRIKHQNQFIIIKKSGFDQNGFQFKTETLELKPLKTC
jgi:hypothetical protein